MYGGALLGGRVPWAFGRFQRPVCEDRPLFFSFTIRFLLLDLRPATVPLQIPLQAPLIAPRHGAQLARVLIAWVLLACRWGMDAADTDQVLSLRSPVTNVAQLRSLVTRQWRIRCDLRLEGVVCAVSVPERVIVLADATGAELFWLDPDGLTLRIGQQVVVSGLDCEVTRRREGLVLSRAPLVDNDGLHSVRDAEGIVELEAGWHPIRVEWFNYTRTGFLEVAQADPGQDLAPIAPDRLGRAITDAEVGRRFEPGLDVECYEGGWAMMPDFGRWTVQSRGLATHFELGVHAQAQMAGVVFFGWLEVTESGRQTFRLRSDDGSRLMIGAPQPRIEVRGEASLPGLQRFYIGQPMSVTNSYQWAAGEGEVARIERRGNGLELQLKSPREGRLQVLVADGAGLPPALLLKNKVQVRGVTRDVLIPGGQHAFGLLTTVSAAEVELVEAAPENWAAHPVTPITGLQSLNSNGNGNSNGIVVHLVGRLGLAQEGSALLLADETGGVFVKSSVAAPALVGMDVEVLGVCRRRDEGWMVEVGFVRPVPKPEEPQVEPLPQLTSAEAVLRLKAEEARQGYPVRLRGVITCLWPTDFSSAILQDSTRGVYLALSKPAVAQGPKIGDFWEVRGVTAAGDFAPIVMTDRITRLSEGRMPEPARPTSEQLINGSLDSQFVEIEGIITEVDGDVVALQMNWGKVRVTITGRQPLELRAYKNMLVQIRGVLLAVWEAQTKQVRVGEFRLASASISTDASLTPDPFAAPEKSLGDLLRYDIQAGPFQRVRVPGQVVGRRAEEFFLMAADGGLRFFATPNGAARIGDLVEVAGFPQLGGPSPVLREAVVRKRGYAALPEPRPLDRNNLFDAANDSTRIRVKALLVNVRVETGGNTLLEMEFDRNPFVARAGFKADVLSKLRLGSRLELTGVYAGQGNSRITERRMDAFELLLDSPSSVRVLAQPPWWTLRRLLTALGLVLVVLAGAMLWVLLLRRRVEAQTEIIREKVEREATLEERTRIARELHDTLEQALAGLSFQLGALAGFMRGMSAEALRTLERARLMVRHGQEEARRTVRNLRMLDLERGNLPAAIEQLAQDAANGLPIHIETTVQGSAIPLSGHVESHLLRIGQEAMTNALKHGRARSIRFELRYDPESVELRVTDDGSGFDVARAVPTEAGHFGLLGMRERANKMGGTLNIVSQPGQGTTVIVRVPRNKVNSQNVAA